MNLVMIAAYIPSPPPPITRPPRVPRGRGPTPTAKEVVVAARESRGWRRARGDLSRGSKEPPRSWIGRDSSVQASAPLRNLSASRPFGSLCSCLLGNTSKGVESFQA